MKIFFVFFFALIFNARALSQEAQAYYVNFLFFDKIVLNNPDAKANGYYNSSSNTIIFNQQIKGEIHRQLLDTGFGVLKNYKSSDNLSIVEHRKKPFFYKEFCSKKGTFELYIDNKKLKIVKLDFSLLKDDEITTIPLKKYYEDEFLLASIPLKDNIHILSYSAQYNKLLSYEYDLDNQKLNYREFALPKMPLTQSEINERGEHLAVNYHTKFESPLYTSPLFQSDRFQLHTESPLFYHNQHLYFLLSMPYKAGYHMLHIDVLQQTMDFKNFIVNKYKGGVPGANDEMLPVATLCDSLLIIQNSDFKNIEYHFYDFFKNEKLKSYKAGTDSSFFDIVHSPLKQYGTITDKEKEKEFPRIKKFLKQKNKGQLFLKAYKEADTLVLIFGSYDIDQTPSAFSPLGFFSVAHTALGLFGPTFSSFFMPQVYVENNNFLYATSQFNYKDLSPYKDIVPNTLIDRFTKDKRMDDLNKQSSFLFEMNKHVYMGLFNKTKKGYDIYKY